MRVSSQGERRKSARPSLRGGYWVTGIPTATVDLFNGIQNEGCQSSGIPAGGGTPTPSKPGVS